MQCISKFNNQAKTYRHGFDCKNGIFCFFKTEPLLLIILQVIFEGIRGSGFQGDLAIDDVLVTNGSCVSSVPTTFPPTRRPATPEGNKK